jgi:hypothetical protein
MRSMHCSVHLQASVVVRYEDESPASELVVCSNHVGVLIKFPWLYKQESYKCSKNKSSVHHNISNESDSTITARLGAAM